MLKRQSVQAKAMSALDEKTNELLLRNAQNTALQSKMVAKLASGSSVSIETLEQSWQTIVKGIEGTKAIQDEMRQKRQDGARRLEVLKQDFVNRGLFGRRLGERVVLGLWKTWRGPLFFWGGWVIGA